VLEPSSAWGPYPGAVTGIALSRDGSTVALAQSNAYRGNSWEVHQLATGLVIPSSGLARDWFRTGVYDLALSDDGRVLATFEDGPVMNDTAVRVFDLATGLSDLIWSSPANGTVPSNFRDLSVGAHGRLVMFAARSDQIVSGDSNGAFDAFVLDRDVDGDGLPSAWEEAFGLEPHIAADAASDADGDGLTALQEFQQNSSPLATSSRYFAEGAANGFFSTRVAVVNPGATPLTLTLRMLGSNGRVTSQTRTIDSLRRDTFDILDVPDTVFSIVLEGTQPFVADRLMTWDKTGFGSSLETAVTSPGTSWYFAEGATGGPYALYYLLQNPGETEAQATVTYLRPAPLPPIVKGYAVPAHSRQTIDVRGEDPGLAAAEVSASIAADRPIVAERAMYFSAPGHSSVPSQPMVAGHAGAGIAAPAPRWFLAEGATGFFDEYVLIANPGMDDAQVSVTYLLEDGSHFSEPLVVARQSRVTVDVKARDPRLAATAVSIIVDSTNAVPIVVERVMWWPHGAWYEASLSAGVTATGSRWLLAEGEEGGASNAQTYVLIANTEAVEVHAVMTVLHEKAGIVDTRDLYLKPNSRTSVSLGSFPLAAGKRFGVLVEAPRDGANQIVVERSLYSSLDGRMWSAGATSVATNISSWP
jgi:hypothetical protein